MKIHQISLFLENRPGQLRVPIKLLAKAGIDIMTLSLADTEQFGILRLIVRDWQKAKQLCEEAGCVVNVTEVVAIEVEDRPGGLDDILEVAERVGMNVEYMYAFTYGREGKAVLILRFDQDADTAIESLKKNGIRVLRGTDLFARAEQSV